MSKRKKSRKTVKCEGRFSGLRNYLYEEAMPLVLETGSASVTAQNLQDIWELTSDELLGKGFDAHDPYYYSGTDKLRKQPVDSFLSLVPLIEAHMHPEDGLVRDYALAMGNNERVADKLEIISHQPRRFLSKHLSRDPKTIAFPDGQTFTGYRLAAEHGIGTISSGGIKGGGIRSDSPYVLEIYKFEGSGIERGEMNLAGVVGFWAQDDDMLVSQIQSCNNAYLPKGVKFGVAALHLAEVVAAEMGFKGIKTYTARGHPIFHEHGGAREELLKTFTCWYDNSAKKLGFSGGRNGDDYHYKALGNGH